MVVNKRERNSGDTILIISAIKYNNVFPNKSQSDAGLCGNSIDLNNCRVNNYGEGKVTLNNDDDEMIGAAT